ncbi:50S ribosomal protein L11 [Patescibacteria group bacterium]|nr:50S ribosomal protein L11 [Patescibacteria group bacterium]MBU1246569.1 50S ribosomal protein L11 [Patescibacteria group bacterium]MBU1519468.1 50S ribosomal protein L11 [Patescibacteria group bacterium]MBU1730558.1 50S ribosomal protein L11 [Patescibacteria group bacterium]MBU1956323.1 50S ribosomal protein L11 [Patescibacteria group bacterium]
MAKKAKKQIKLQVLAGKATPAPPLGPALGQAGINIGEFVNQFNDKTKEMMGDIMTVLISVYDDRTFDFILKSPPTSSLLRKAADIKKGSGKNATKTVSTITKTQLQEIAKHKMEDLNANNIEAAMKIIEGSARSMGIKIK